MDFTEASRTITYNLKVCRQDEIIKWTLQKHKNSYLHSEGCVDKGEMIKWTPQMHQEQSLTSLKCADKEK